MLQRFRDHFGTAGLIVAIVALVAALAGGAIAANGGGGGKATASKAGPRGKTGKTGKTGPQGPVGPVGPAGPAGAKGDPGANGSAGTNGTNGTNGEDGEDGQNGADGTSVTKTPEPAGANCKEGGTKFVIGNSTPSYACDGEPWTAGGTLPSGATETGVWSFGQTNEQGQAEHTFLPVSFSIPLSAPLDQQHVHVIGEDGEELVGSPEEPTEQPSSACVGDAAAPTAAAGHLCVYTGWNVGLKNGFPDHTNGPKMSQLGVLKPTEENAAGVSSGASTSGAILDLLIVPNSSWGFGTWAVTAP